VQLIEHTTTAIAQVMPVPQQAAIAPTAPNLL
jgi:hypothetical protein